MPEVTDATRQLRKGNTSGFLAACVKSKLSDVSLAAASLPDIVASPKRFSINLRIDVKSYCVWEM